ncbi:MAG: hypothetical protein ACKOB5_00470, partial [Betaproteobacteria bacterium]
ECVQVSYVNPNTGSHVQNNLGYYALMLRPGQTLRLPARSPSQVFHAIEGEVDVAVSAATSAAVSASGTTNAHSFTLAEADTCCTPGYEAVKLANRSASEPAFLFIADESPQLLIPAGTQADLGGHTPLADPQIQRNQQQAAQPRVDSRNHFCFLSWAAPSARSAG